MPTKRRRSASGEAVTRLDRAGFPLPTRPSDEPTDLPGDLTEIDDRELMRLFQEYTAWHIYATGKFSVATIVEHEAEAAVRLLEAKATVANWWSEEAKSADKVVTIVSARRELTLDLQEARDAVLQAYAYRKMLDTVVVRFERTAALLSRELTRRMGPSGPERRTYRGA